VAAGLAASVAAWGSSTFYPLLHAAQRPSKGLSIFRFLRGAYSPLRLFTDSPDADFLSGPLMVAAGGAVFFLALKWRLRSVPAAIAGILTGLTFYKVGHAQFLPVVVASLWYWFAVEGIVLRGSGRLVSAAAVYSAWAGLVAWLYFLTGLLMGITFGFMGRWEFFRDIIGLPSFLVALWLLFEIMGRARRPGRLTWRPACGCQANG